MVYTKIKALRQENKLSQQQISEILEIKYQGNTCNSNRYLFKVPSTRSSKLSN